MRCEVCRFDLDRRDRQHRPRPGSRFCTVCNGYVVNPPANARHEGGRYMGPGSLTLAEAVEDRVATGQRLHARLRGELPGWGRFEGPAVTGLMFQEMSTESLLGAFLSATS